MDCGRLIDELISGCDLGTEEGKTTAYARCADYADKNIDHRRALNDFMQLVAKRLDVLPVRLDSFLDTVGDPPEGARIHVKVVKENLVNVTGNADGLRYLASLILELARDAVEHDHAHLYADEPPMCGDVYLTVYHEPDPWFKSLDKEGSAEEEQTLSVAERDIDPSEIAALCVLAKTPPAMRLTPNRPYRVLSVDVYQGQGIWERRIRESDERFFVFTLVNDEGSEEAYGFDLDDPNVLLFSQQDVAGLQGPD